MEKEVAAAAASGSDAEVQRRQEEEEEAVSEAVSQLGRVHAAKVAQMEADHAEELEVCGAVQSEAVIY
jgi:hypothetical protein